MAGQPEQIILRLGNGLDLLLDRWPDGTVEASVREAGEQVWTPVELRGGSVRVVAGSVAS